MIFTFFVAFSDFLSFYVILVFVQLMSPDFQIIWKIDLLAMKTDQ